jgi:hypothetical protein
MLNISNDKINRFIELIEHLNDYTEKIKNPSLNPTKEKLLTFLDKLSIEELSDVIALMYSGRDGSKFSYLKEQFGGNEKRRENYVDKIFEKRTELPRYLRDGLSQLDVD